MNQERCHLIHANLALAKAALDDKIMKGFVQQIEQINSLARMSEGFIAELNPVGVDEVYGGRWLLNVSSWKSVDSLAKFTYSGMHSLALKNRRDWFEKQDIPSYVLFWFDASVVPTAVEIKQRLDRLATDGPTPYAFNFKNAFKS